MTRHKCHVYDTNEPPYFRVRVLHELAGESGRHIKSMDCTEKADADADEGRGRGRGPV